MENLDNSHSPHLVVINVGGATIKIALFRLENSQLIQCERYIVKRELSEFVSCLKTAIQECKNQVISVAHRIVATEPEIQSPSIIDRGLLNSLSASEQLAPNHNPFAIAIIKVCIEEFGENIPQTIHCDSEFFKNLPEVASDFAPPKIIASKCDFSKKGFHGFAHRSMLSRLKENLSKKDNQTFQRAPMRVLSIQLGSGCSICAILDGQPIDISMGVSTNEGLIMSCRSGDLDVYSVLRAIQDQKISIDQFLDELQSSSGLYALSGYSADVSNLLKSNQQSDQLAIQKYCYRIRKYMGAYVAVLGGLDFLLIGGGVGFNNEEIRRLLLNDWQHLSMFHEEKGFSEINEPLKEISSDESKVKIYLCDIDEEVLIAEDCQRMIIMNNANRRLTE